MRLAHLCAWTAVLVWLAPSVGVSMSGAPAVRDDQQSPASGTGRPAIACGAAVTALRLPDVRITEAIPVAASTRPADPIKVAHCKASGVIGKEIRFMLLLPDEWNQKFFMGGAGGFAGQVENQAQASVNLGYATVGTDTGHQGIAFQAAWALNDLERQVNFGHLAVHRTAEVAKAIVRAYYGVDASRSYFLGCSNGGRQAMMEAQRYPDDFDGIVSAAPAMDFTGIAGQFIRNAQVTFPDPANLSASTLTTDNLKLVESSVLAACDAVDGVKDGVMEDPRRCTFDPASIPACAGDRAAADCLTKTQVAAVKTLYSQTTNKNGVIRAAQPFGGEGDPAGWQAWVTGVNPQVFGVSKMPSLHFAFGVEFFKYFVFGDPSWNYTTYDLGAWDKDTKLTGTVLNATSENLAPFKARGGKLILWHGWSDPALTANASVKYYEQVEARDANVRDYFRMFMLPGVLHCAGGTGPDRADWYDAIADWVERGKAPDRVVAEKRDRENKVVRTRPLCVYPLRAVYTGSGDTNAAESFVCRS